MVGPQCSGAHNVVGSQCGGSTTLHCGDVDCGCPFYFPILPTRCHSEKRRNCTKVKLKVIKLKSSSRRPPEEFGCGTSSTYNLTLEMRILCSDKLTIGIDV